MQLSQLLEEKTTLSIQLSDTSQSLHESQQDSSDLFKHCAVLEKQGPPNVAIPGAPQEMNPKKERNPETTGEPQPRLSEAQQQLGTTDQEMSALRNLLKEEQEQRLAIENALSLAEEQIRRLGQSQRVLARTPTTGACGSQETSVRIDIPASSCPRVRGKDAGRALLWEWAEVQRWAVLLVFSH
uniref:golgin subfamily B member 1-like n=1 Tax=Myodes glareolus TaxID=447135 RepID=UPI0020221E2A|nr:golgin subfamily B member 1-like [Myodes glareolus]